MPRPPQQMQRPGSPPMPPQGMPPQGMPPQGMPPQGMPPQQRPMGPPQAPQGGFNASPQGMQQQAQIAALRNGGRR